MSTQKVPFFDYPRIFEPYREALNATFNDVLDRGAYILQRDLLEFEESLAQYCGVRHAIGVANCTDGLTIQLHALGIQPGDEVLVSTHTFIATAAAVVHAGGIPVPVDIGTDGLMSAESAEKACTSRTRYLMPTQLNGRVCDMDRLTTLANERSLELVEDAAQALGATYNNRKAGTFGRAASFSFYPAKLLGALGDAGAIITDDDDLAAQMRLLRDHGRSPTGEVVRWSYNSRLDNIQAAFLSLFLKDLDRSIERRREIAQQYGEGLQGLPGLTLPPLPASTGQFDVFQNFELRSTRREALRQHLADHGVGSIIQWAGWPVHQNKQLGFTSELPEADHYFDECFMIPLHTALRDSDVEYVIATMKSFHGV